MFDRFPSLIAASSCFVAGSWAWLGENSAQIGSLFAAAGFACMAVDRVIRCRRSARRDDRVRSLSDFLLEIEERRVGEERRSGADRRKSSGCEDNG